MKSFPWKCVSLVLHAQIYENEWENRYNVIGTFVSVKKYLKRAEILVPFENV